MHVFLPATRPRVGRIVRATSAQKMASLNQGQAFCSAMRRTEQKLWAQTATAHISLSWKPVQHNVTSDRINISSLIFDLFSFPLQLDFFLKLNMLVIKYISKLASLGFDVHLLWIFKSRWVYLKLISLHLKITRFSLDLMWLWFQIILSSLPCVVNL